MLSINYLSTFFGEKQIDINNSYYDKINIFERNKNSDLIKMSEKNNSINKYYLNLMQSFEILFNKSVTNFYYDKKIYKNKSIIFTFLNSLLNIIDETFNFYDINDKENVIKEFITLIDNDLFQKNLYNKFNYTKNRKFNKTDIQEVLKNALYFKSCDKFYLLKEYISDYLGINIYIIKLNNNLIDFSNCEFYLSKYYNNNFTKYLPNIILINDNDVFMPILKYNKEILHNTSCLMYLDNKNIIDNLWDYLKINEIYYNNKLNEELNNEELNNEEIIINEETVNNDNKKKYNIDFLNNLKIDIIKKLCNDNNILLQKKSDKTNKLINKLKNELINDLLKI